MNAVNGGCSTPLVVGMNGGEIDHRLDLQSTDWATTFDDYLTGSLLDDGGDWTSRTWSDLDTFTSNCAESQQQSEGYSTDGSPLSSPVSAAVSNDVCSPPIVDAGRTAPDYDWNGDDLAEFLSDHVLDACESEDSAVSLSRSSSSSGASAAQDDVLAKLISDTIDANVFTEERLGQSSAPQFTISLEPPPPQPSRQQGRYAHPGAAAEANSQFPSKSHQQKLAAAQCHTPVSTTFSNEYQVPVHQQQAQAPATTTFISPVTVVTPPSIALVQATPVITAVPVNCSQTALIQTPNARQQILVVTTNGPGIIQRGGRDSISRGQLVHTPLSRRPSLAATEKPNQRCGPYMPIRPKQKHGRAPLSVATTAMEVCETASTLAAEVSPAPSAVLATPAPASLNLMAPSPAPGRPLLESPTLDPAGYEKLSEAEVAATRRQSRMIRNREAATISRQRKKEFVQSLQERLNEAILENDKLKRENVVLRDTAASLRAENEKLKGEKRGASAGTSSSRTNGRIMWSSGTKATVCVFALVFLLSINVGSYWNAYYPQELRPIAVSRLNDEGGAMAESDNYVAGRRLLYVSNSRDTREVSPEDDWKQKHDRNASRAKLNATNETLGGGDRNNASTIPSCLLFNRTESLMLAERLNSWARQHESERTSRYKLKKRPSASSIWNEADEEEIAAFWSGASGDAARYRLRNGLSSSGDPMADLPPFPSGAAEVPPSRKRGQLKEVRGGDGPENAIERRKLDNNSKQWSLQIYEGNELKYVKFLEALHRRDDTFYVISFLRDYLLLPANSFNKTGRPRMSLVMPALPLNESMQPPPHHVAMMQIECEVTGTSLLHLPEALIPSFLLQNRTSSFDQKSRPAANSRSESNKSSKPTPSDQQKRNRRKES